MGAATDLTTIQNVKARLRLPGAATSDDSLLELMITEISLGIQSYLGRTIASQNYSDSYDGHGTRRIFFNQYPVTAVASLTVDGIAIPAASGPPWANGYVFDAKSISLYDYRFCRGYSNVQAAYTAGYASTPGDLEEAVLEVVMTRFKELNRIGQKTAAVQGAETASWDLSALPPTAKLIISQYRRVIPFS